MPLHGWSRATLREVSESLLGQISRHGVSGLRDPREDRLTEICAAIFSTPPCEGLAIHVARGWIGAAASDSRLSSSVRTRFSELDALLKIEGEWSCAVSTQVSFASARGRRRPDLELRLRCGIHELLLWIEVKHGTAPHTRQLKAYAAEQTRRGRPAAVLLLAPRADYTWFEDTQIPADVPRLTWEQTSRLVATFQTDDAIAGFLIGDLRAYLNEEGLMDPPRLTPGLVDALINHHAARDALDRICEVAASELTRLGHGPPEDGHWPQNAPREFWWSYPKSCARAGAAIPGLEWSWELILDSSDVLKNGRVGVPCLLAGATTRAGGTRRLDADTRAALAEAEFHVLGIGDSNSSEWDFIVRVKPVAEWPSLLVGEDVEAQGLSLANWINNALLAAREILKKPDKAVM